MLHSFLQYGGSENGTHIHDGTGETDEIVRIICAGNNRKPLSELFCIHPDCIYSLSDVAKIELILNTGFFITSQKMEITGILNRLQMM
jgi:hypothetical protein